MAKNKGAEGEREIYRALNPILQQVMTTLGYPEQEVALAANAIQRNQNQSAVGGNDLSNTFGLSIEVKRQEQLSIGTWWKQTVEAAERNKEHPVLLYRQNRKPWRCRTLGYIELPEGKFIRTVIEISWEDFQEWFRNWVIVCLESGQEVRC